MLVDTQDLVSLTEANQNFSRVARLVDERGSVVIMRNNVPRYVLVDYNRLDTSIPDTEVLDVTRRFIDQFRPALEELAQ